MTKGGAGPENPKKLVRFKTHMVCPVKGLPRSMRNRFSNSFFAMVKASALQQGNALLLQKVYIQVQEHIDSPHSVAVE